MGWLPHICFTANETDNTILGTAEYIENSRTPLTMERLRTETSTAWRIIVQGMRTCGGTTHARAQLMPQSSPAIVPTTALAVMRSPSDWRLLYWLPSTDKTCLGKTATTPTNGREKAKYPRTIWK